MPSSHTEYAFAARHHPSKLPKHGFCNNFVKARPADICTWDLLRDLLTAEGDTGATCSLLQHFL